METVTLYSTHCPKCQVLEKKLAKKGINFTICDNTDIMKERGWIEAPILEVNGKIMKFHDAVEWINKG